jgi:pimeloyl-ACP methyl ester carboxylesterase
MRFPCLAFVAVFTLAVWGPAAPASEAVQLDTGHGILYGTLELPAGKGPFPVALIHAGSGPTDRDGNSYMGLATNNLKQLAEALAKEGIASLRYDKRLIGKSAGAGPMEKDLRFDDYIRDAQLWGEKLQHDPHFSGLYIIGHSEGSLIGMVAAQKLNVSGFVSICGAGTPAGDILREQLSGKLQPPLKDRAMDIIAQLERGQTVADTPPELVTVFRPSVQPYEISWFKFDPAKEIAKLRCPVLVIDGTTDIQISAHHATRLAEANPKAIHRRIQGMNHILKMVPDDMQQQLASYTNPNLPLAPELASTIVEFIHNCEHGRGGKPLTETPNQERPAK